MTRWRMLQRGEAALPVVSPVVDDGPAAERSRRLRCATCGRAITTPEARVEVDGKHVHTRMNPDGLSFTFGCFSGADGLVAAGAPSRQATWFAGCFWWIQLCGGCRTHLGWLFFGDGCTDFYGLVLGRLREAP